MVLHDGGEHQLSPTNPDQYNISTFTTNDVPLQNSAQEDTHVSRSDTRILALTLPELLRHARNPDQRAARPYRIEFNKRFSYPFACLVLMLVGVPLGLSSKRGGKSTGFVTTIILVFIYYFLSSLGVAFASQGRLSPLLGVWGANFLFAAAGALLLQQMSRGGVAISVFSSLGVALSRVLARLRPRRDRQSSALTTQLPQRLRSLLHIRFPLILDDYIMRAFGSNFAVVLSSFSSIFLIFTLFELTGPIIRNRTPLVTVGDYLLNLIPYILYNVTPLCVLVAVLITFGALSRTSEFTAMKAAGVSLYRVVTPVLVLTAVIAAALFTFDEFYLPAANRRQEALLSVIKGRPAQTFLRPDRQWISGQTFAQEAQDSRLPSFLPQTPFSAAPAPFSRRAAEPARIFYYQFFDADKNQFANLTVFEFDPATFTLERRVFAASAHWDPGLSRWVFEQGWGPHLPGRNHLLLPALPPHHLSRDPRAAPVLQKRRSPLAGDELSPAHRLHRRPAPVRV